MSLTVSVDVKQYWIMLRHWSQFVPNMPTDIRGHEALHHHHHVRLTESTRDQEKGGELDSHEEARLKGGELDSHEEARLSFAGPGEIRKTEVVLDPQESPEEIKSSEVELSSEFWTVFCFSCSATAVLRTLSLWLCSAQQLKQQLAEYTSCFAMVRSLLP